MQSMFEDATGYNREKDGVESYKGMRGVVVYNRENHKQLFLPVGKTGYGRRKANNGAWAPAPKDPDGGLRYASRSEVMSGARKYTPCFMIYINVRVPFIGVRGGLIIAMRI